MISSFVFLREGKGYIFCVGSTNDISSPRFAQQMMERNKKDHLNHLNSSRYDSNTNASANTKTKMEKIPIWSYFFCKSNKRFGMSSAFKLLCWKCFHKIWSKSVEIHWILGWAPFPQILFKMWNPSNIQWDNEIHKRNDIDLWLSSVVPGLLI